jgi:hypothetical protein
MKQESNAIVKHEIVWLWSHLFAMSRLAYRLASQKYHRNQKTVSRQDKQVQANVMQTPMQTQTNDLLF